MGATLQAVPFLSGDVCSEVNGYQTIWVRSESRPYLLYDRFERGYFPAAPVVRATW